MTHAWDANEMPEGYSLYDAVNWQIELARLALTASEPDNNAALAHLRGAQATLVAVRKAEGAELATIEAAEGATP